mmetsp:Transcript_2542/g.3747  ORF Transcript_2542/g.3747 Transcript_2542/m.3747 type:complete len:141 (-) Transcript_2542:142-564(-)|eukprot:CAMPEP_0194204668 /NCGR_PEP_ID=MMETSP0156-20130528/4127_1 /TAXON_ID=33649 /ORGANISM="Thalassionema nitzschioides, Strain L26-B" /LENGTH=140 /DNA_ID=CAMNT_0038930737 /DNA_START=174 /DNA_END=596 /DNA_ORIENTATION=+
MATRGIYQLQKMTIVYCEHGGSSRAVRDFISSGRIIEWAEQHPHIEFELKLRNGYGKHPFVKGEYLTGPSKQVCVKNEPIEKLYHVMEMLKNSSGRKMTRLKEPVMTQTPSIQGIWTPMLNLQDVGDFEINIVSPKSPPS